MSTVYVSHNHVYDSDITFLGIRLFKFIRGVYASTRDVGRAKGYTY